MKIRKFYTFIEDEMSEAGRPGEPPLRKVAAVAVVENPNAGRYVEDLKPMIEASEELGRQLSIIALRALDPYRAQSYGKGGIVGLAGEQEHINALLTTTFANPLREAVGGGKAWISSMTKRGGPRTSIDIPLACKDPLYIRSRLIHRCTTRLVTTPRARRRLGFLRATRTAALLPPSRRRKFMCRADPQIRRG
ncbi:MAG: peptide synthetase [Acidobacteria bacterium]|nr:MAG: peptide synthetase [Acidobacteriota bacterium]